LFATDKERIMSRLKNTTALSLAFGLGLGLASVGPGLAAEKGESGAAGPVHQENLPSDANLGAAGAVKTPGVAQRAEEQNQTQTQMDKSEGQQAADASKSEMGKSAEAEQAAGTIPGGLTAEQIIGRDVVNKNGEDVGQVERLVIQPDKGDVHAVISVGGFLGIGDRDVAIPLKEMEFGEENVTLMSQQTKEDLEALPEYEENEWTPYE
jgi:hypothetical protein